jgi:hypothetical protein
MDNGHSTRPDGSPTAREPWAGRRPGAKKPAGRGADPGEASSGGPGRDAPVRDPEGDVPFEERLRRAEEDLRHEREAAASARAGGSPPRGPGAPPRRRGGLDFAALFALLDSLRRAVPAELQERVTALIREALLTLRSLIDWYLERLDHPEREPRVEDIPID